MKNTTTETPRAARNGSFPGLAEVAFAREGQADRDHVLDPVNRRRDRHGNRLPWFYSHAVPTVEDVPLERTPYADAVAAIRERLPIAAAELHAHYDHKLRPAVRRLNALNVELESRVTAGNDDVERHNADLDARWDAETQADRAALALAEDALAIAHEEAGHRVAEDGGTYDPENPSPDLVLRPYLEDERAIAARLSLPWSPGDRERHVVLHPAVGLALTGLVGGMIGVSLAIAAHFVPASQPFARPVPLAALAAVGIAAATGAKWAIKKSARESAVGYWAGRSRWHWLGFGVFSGLLALTVLVIDSLIEREGLMAGVRLQAMASTFSGKGGGESKESLYLLMAVVLTFGYVLHAWCEGIVAGRFDGCWNRVQAERERLRREHDQSRRSTASAQVALEALATVAEQKRRCGHRERRIGVATARRDAERRTLRDGLTPEERLRLQDAVDQLCGTQATFDSLLEDARRRCEGGFWDRLRALFGPDLYLRRRERRRRL